MLNNSSVLSSMAFCEIAPALYTAAICFNAISQNLDKNIETEVIILDLAKAFDSVYHYKLMF